MAGCDEKKEKPVTEYSESLISEEKENPVAEYGEGLMGIHEGSKVAGQQITLKSIRNAIQIYYASNSRYPEAFDDIQKLMDEPLDPEMYDYNPETGRINFKKE